jgi:hypothetical protein
MPEQAFDLPEFTRSLRALAVPSAPGSDHDRIFAPLLQARTTANRVKGPDAQVAAFDAARLERDWRAAIAQLAASRHAKSAPDRRALEAELDLLAKPLWESLARLNSTAAALRLAGPESKHAAWQKWIAAVQQVFDGADDWWRLSLPVLGDSRGRRGSFWRRILRRSQ